MKLIAALAAALSLSLAAAAPRSADACGDYGSFQRRETAVGIWPSIARRDGQLLLELHYPRFALSGEHLYMDSFVLVRDARLRQFERALAAPDARGLRVTVEEVAPGRWRVRSWEKKQNAGA